MVGNDPHAIAGLDVRRAAEGADARTCLPAFALLCRTSLTRRIGRPRYGHLNPQLASAGSVRFVACHLSRLIGRSRRQACPRVRTRAPASGVERIAAAAARRVTSRCERASEARQGLLFKSTGGHTGRAPPAETSANAWRLPSARQPHPCSMDLGNLAPCGNLERFDSVSLQ